MDPQARLATWEIIRELKQNGATILLTTHLMDEAERLADRVAIIDHGRLVALDTPSGLTGAQNSTVVRFVAPCWLRLHPTIYPAITPAKRRKFDQAVI